MVPVNKFLLHQPLNRQSKTYAREGIEIDVSTLADRVGACVVALDPIVQAIRTHVMSAERIHADDPQAWLADVLARIANIPQSRLHELLPWMWKCAAPNPAAQAA
jgi:hypothetical protein